MIKLTDINGHTRYVAASAIASVTEAGASSQWHGIKSIVKLFDGLVIECQQTADDVALKVMIEENE